MPTRDITGLELALGQLSETLELFILPALTPSMLGCKGTSECASFKHPRITCVEFAVASSHDLARQTAKKNDPDMAMIFEDDAFIRSNFSEYMQIFEQEFSVDRMPVGMHCFPEQFGILVKRKDRKLLKCVKIPDYAVAYILNRAALNVSIIKEGEGEFEVADWPKHMKKIKWMAPLESIVEHREVLSFVKASRGLRQAMFSKGPMQKFNEKLVALAFRLARLFGHKYGASTIASEKLRSFVLGAPYA